MTTFLSGNNLIYQKWESNPLHHDLLKTILQLFVYHTNQIQQKSSNSLTFIKSQVVIIFRSILKSGRHLRTNVGASRTGESVLQSEPATPNWVTASKFNGHGAFFSPRLFLTGSRRPILAVTRHKSNDSFRKTETSDCYSVTYVCKSVDRCFRDLGIF